MRKDYPAAALANKLPLFHAILLLSSSSLQAEPPQAHSFPSLPDAEGWAGMYAGVSAGSLLAAGGAQFPEKKPWAGGTKVWQDRVFALAEPTAQWQQVGQLPRPLGYGGSVTLPSGLLCLGGSDSQQHHRQCFLLQLQHGTLHTQPWPDLPQPLANHAAVLMGQHIYLFGGTEAPSSTTASAQLWRMALSPDPQTQSKPWTPLPPCPGKGRIYSALAVVGEQLLVFGGISLTADAEGKPQRHYLQDAWAYSEAHGWQPLPPPPSPLSACPNPAPLLQGRVLLAGADDGSLVDFQPKEKHPGFRPVAWWYHPQQQKYEALPLKPTSVTCPTVEWRGHTLRISGELRPAIRTPTVIGWKH